MDLVELEVQQRESRDKLDLRGMLGLILQLQGFLVDLYLVELRKVWEES